MSDVSDAAARDVKISKAMSRLLRHSAIKEGIPIDAEGWVPILNVLNHPRLKSYRTSLTDLQRVVAQCKKQRFRIENDKIRANQGHLIAEVLTAGLVLLTPESMPSEVYHGTYASKLPIIVKSGGLSRMKRNQIHFTLPQVAPLLGVRHNVNTLIYVNIKKCMERGMQFYKSENDVILCAGDSLGIISVDCFDKVIDSKGISIDWGQHLNSQAKANASQ